MQGQFVDLMAAADFLGPAAVEVDRYQTEIFDIVRRRQVIGQRIKQVPARGTSLAILCGDGDSGAQRGAGIRRSAKYCAHGANTGSD